MLYTVGEDNAGVDGRVLSLHPWLLLVFHFMELLLMPESGFVTKGPALWGFEVV